MIEYDEDSTMSLAAENLRAMGRDIQMIVVDQTLPLPKVKWPFSTLWVNLEVFPECRERSRYSPSPHHDCLLRAFDDDGTPYFEFSAVEDHVESIADWLMYSYGVTLVVIHDLHGEAQGAIG